MAERLGQPLMPWQRLVADVGGEIDSDTGLPAYREVVITVPRQSGKTTLILGWEIQRALGWDGPQRIAYSAQTGADARKKLIEDQAPVLEPRKKKLGIRRILRANGNEAVEFVNGSRITLLASAAESGHGKTLDLGIKDEFFADYDDRRDQALRPAMITRAAAQVVTASTMGTDESVPLNQLVDRGRQAVDSGQRSGVAYFEWSAADDADPDDPATWWSCMPALGFTVLESTVRGERGGMKDSEFRRAYLNQQTQADERVIPLATWVAVCSEAVQPSGPLVFALDMNPERSAAAVVAAGGGVLELVDYRSGAGWVAGRVKELDEKWHPLWVVDSTGPAASLIPDLEREGLTVRAVSSREVVDACGGFYDAVAGRAVTVRANQILDDAVAGAMKRTVGDAWAWARRSATVDISPLVAATLAHWGARSGEARYDGPMVAVT